MNERGTILAFLGVALFAGVLAVMAAQEVVP